MPGHISLDLLGQRFPLGHLVHQLAFGGFLLAHQLDETTGIRTVFGHFGLQTGDFFLQSGDFALQHGDALSDVLGAALGLGLLDSRLGGFGRGHGGRRRLLRRPER